MERWTLSELVGEVASRIAALPAPTNGQVRAVPDERTVRYYGTIGLLDRPVAMRGRTALYDRRHLAQVVAIKRLQTMGRSLADIQAMWPTLDDHTLTRMSGIALASAPRAPAREAFWKREPVEVPAPEPVPPMSDEVKTVVALELRLQLAPGVSLVIAAPDNVALSSADVLALRDAAAPLVAELARCQLTKNDPGGEP